MGSVMVGAADRWFGAMAAAAGDVRLFCLPYAGGGASAFRDWPGLLPAAVEAVAIRLPGRESRIGEPPEIDVAAIAEAISARVDGPYALYGHSMGARLAFEVARELGRRDVTPPLRLYVAAARPPDETEPLGVLARSDDEELVRRVTELGGTPPEVFEVPELRELLLPVLRADFAWLDGYRYADAEPLPVPIVALGALDDVTLPATAMLGWRRHTARWFRLATLRGGHFFLNTAAGRVVTIVADDLLHTEVRR